MCTVEGVCCMAMLFLHGERAMGYWIASSSRIWGWAGGGSKGTDGRPTRWFESVDGGRSSRVGSLAVISCCHDIPSRILSKETFANDRISFVHRHTTSYLPGRLSLSGVRRSDESHDLQRPSFTFYQRDRHNEIKIGRSVLSIGNKRK